MLFSPNSEPPLKICGETMAFMWLCTFRVCRFLIVILISALNSSYSQGETNSHSESLSSESNMQLEYFCECGLLVDRGLANSSPFIESADTWIVMLLQSNQQFRKYLEISIQQGEAFSAYLYSPDFSSDAKGHSLAIIGFDTPKSFAIRDNFVKELSKSQHRKLLLAYLDLEGLMALRRSGFRELLSIDGRLLERITDICNESWEDDVRLLHGRLFTLRNNQKEEIPRINLELRLQSVKLDRKILSLLSENQRVILAPIIQDALKITEFVIGPGIGGNLQEERG